MKTLKNILTAALLLTALTFAACSPEKSGDTTSGNTAIDNILTRTSIRIYQQKAVESAKIDTLLRAGMAAPTACDQRAWHFVVVDDPATLEALSKTGPYTNMAAQAPLAIAVCGDLEKAQGGCGEYWQQDAAAATENILLAAHAMGLGAVWTGAYPDEERCQAISAVLQLPETLMPLNIIVIGYPGETPTPKNKFDEKNISYNRYGTARPDEMKAQPRGESQEFHAFDVVDEYGENPFATFREGWLLCAGDKQKSNAMTIGWGAFGTLWRQTAVTVYVAQERYTKQFMDNHKYFTIMQFGPGYEEVLDYMGHNSGRDGDKAAHLGLHTAYTENGTPYYEEASVVIECEVMYADDFRSEGMKEIPAQLYSDFPAGVHAQYIGKVVKAMKK